MITILTPTYNREKYLKRLYQSLLNQTSHNFEWIVVDDGSTDRTEILINHLQKLNNPFSILYYKKKNEGKHIAINYGVSVANGEYLFILDSDDWIVHDAIINIEKWLNNISTNESKCIGVSGLRGKDNNGIYTIIGKYPKNKECVYATNLERYKKKLTGDKAEVYKTDLMKLYPFPIFNNEKFMPENVVWDKMALDGYYLKWYPKIITITEYLPGGLTNTSIIEKFKNNYKGYSLSYYYSWIGLNFPYNYRSAVDYYIKLKIIGKNKNELVKNLKLNMLDKYIIIALSKIKKFYRR